MLTTKTRPCALARGCTVLLTTYVVLSTGCGAQGATDIIQSRYTTNGAQPCKPGVSFYTGFWGFATTSSEQVQVTGVHVLGVPHGLQVVGIYAVSTTDGQSLIGLAAEALVRRYRQPEKFYSPSHAVLLPRDRPAQWYFVIEVRATDVGHFSTSGLEVSDASGSQTFPDRIEVTAVTKEPHPDDCPADL